MSTPILGSDSPGSVTNDGVQYSTAHQVVKNMALEFCQLLFSNGSTVLKWDPDQSKTGITICDKYAFNLKAVGATPCIVANRGPLNWMKSSGFQQMQNKNLRTGAVTTTDLVRGAVTLSCFSREGLEAEAIAGLIWESFQMFRSALRNIGNRGRMVPNHLGFFKIEATTMGEEALVKGDVRPSISVVPVAVAAMVQRRYLVTPQARPLLGIAVRTTRNP